MSPNKLFLNYLAKVCEEMGVHIKTGKISQFERLKKWHNYQDDIVYVISLDDQFEVLESQVSDINTLANATTSDLRNIPENMLDYKNSSENRLYLFTSPSIDRSTLTLKTLNYLLNDLKSKKISLKELSSITGFDHQFPFSNNSSILKDIEYLKDDIPDDKNLANLLNQIISRLPFKPKYYEFNEITDVIAKINIYNKKLDQSTFEKTVLDLWGNFNSIFSDIKNQRPFIQSIQNMGIDTTFLESKINKDTTSIDIFSQEEIQIEYILIKPQNLMTKYNLPKANNIRTLTQSDYETYLTNTISLLNRAKHKKELGFQHAITENIPNEDGKVIMVGFINPVRPLKKAVSTIITKSFEFLSTADNNMSSEDLKHMSSFDFRDLLKEEMPKIIQHTLLAEQVYQINQTKTENKKTKIKI